MTEITEKMADTKRDIECEFGMAIVAAAGDAGRAGMAARLPADDIYDATIRAALLYAATMSQRRLTEAEFICLCRVIFEKARQGSKALTAAEKMDQP